ncbi:MAG: DUF2833 domain-containing protein [Candidatus Thiodiazotropha taylori]|uniref:DUF2833 domain-containing protein n=1 Tax=Candidatus Thiodiazotropha taylori TaxID=2792791 RepID=A0A9E4N7X5_9GAMM|nr:DUF2833 domain-containing protein [Candidatus Thiodiazotropha taylori]MCW4259246.1 DUF2833 domain-containing protein [Candidatus Thiodiazotropha taylori]
MPADEYTITHVTDDDIPELVANLRVADMRELRALSSKPYPEIVKTSIKVSTEAYTLRVDDQLLCIFGMGVLSIASLEGAPWMIGTEAINQHRRAFLEASKEVSTSMLKRYAYLRQFVDVRNTLAVRWLKWLGFEFSDPMPIGRNGEMFYLFTMENL